MDVIKVKLDKWAKAPERAHSTDAGLDLKTPVHVIVPAHGSVIIDTGVHVEIPEGYVGEIDGKSGLNMRNSIMTFGTVDSGYTGSIVVKLYNLGEVDVGFNIGAKICQLVIKKIITPAIVVVEDLEDTERGANGFGSTGA